MIPNNTQQSNPSHIEAQRGINSYFPILISLGVTTYGFYLFLNTITTSQTAIYLTVAFLAILILFIEAHRTMLLLDFFNSKLTNKLHDNVKIAHFSIVMSGIITALFIALDMWGAIQASDSVERMLAKGIATSSKAYQLLEDEATNGTKMKREYNQELKAYNEAKDSHYTQCNQAWRLPTYRTKNSECKSQFKQELPTAPNSNTKGSIDAKQYEALENQALAKIQGYKEIFFYVFFGFSLLLNYFAVSDIVNQYRKNDRELTPETIKELKNRYELLQAEKLTHLEGSTRLQAQKAHEKTTIDLGIEALIHDIRLAKEQRAYENMKKVPIAIHHRPHDMEQYKYGFVGSNTDSYSTEPYNTDTIDLSKFNSNEIELIKLLWRNGNVHPHGSLTNRDTVLKEIGNTKAKANELRDLYNKLLEHDYIYKRVGYFAKANLG
ncbi:MAG: hypothetical protein JXQ76_05940 [Campylobacterales bacterium]|nr:hypothetical protein [Campylobacterales bacterium]